jgi:hypothetical protein
MGGMMGNTRQLIPVARKDELVIQEVPGETLIYDLKSHKAHCLNRTAALVWKYCDGKHTAEQAAHKIEAELGMAVSDEVVWLAVEQLERLKLLQAAKRGTHSMTRMTRREAVRRLGITAAIALPLITSIVAPEAAQAASGCASAGQACDPPNPPCCPGFNCDGICFPS